MDNNTINSKNKWETVDTQYDNRKALIMNGYKVAIIEHYIEAQDKINKNILDALNEYDKLKEDNKMLLEAIKGCYNLFEAEYEDLSDQGKRIRLKVIDAIQQCNGEDEIEKKTAKEISDKLLKNINIITDQYRKDHNIKPL